MNSNIIELKLIEEKTFICGIANFFEGVKMKNFIKNLEEHFNFKVMKKKNNINNEIESYVNLDYCEKIKNYLINTMHIDEQIIKIENQNEKKEEKNPKKTNSIIENINKKIYLQYVKERRTSRTYIMGLTNFIEEKDILKLSKILQQNMGTNSIINEDGNCGFNGDYTIDTAKKTIMRECILKNTNIQKNLLDF
jgi:hypothetical protein